MKVRIVVKYGAMVPRWYLPVRRMVDRAAYDCWLAPLAMIVIPLIIMRDSFNCAWMDLVRVAEDISSLARSKRIARKVGDGYDH